MNTTELTEHDWLQIENAARGCCSGTSDEWPDLVAAIEKIRGEPLEHRKTAAWLSGFCAGVLSLANRPTALRVHFCDAP